MRNILSLLLLIVCFSTTTMQAVEDTPKVENSVQVDTKNVMALVKDLVIIRTHDGSIIWNLNSRNSYLEAYDVHTGALVWYHKSVGMIVSFVIHDNGILVYRNYNCITALDVNTGNVVWSQQTQGEYSTLAGE